MSDTPTTDAYTHSADETPLDEWVYAGHAKLLERERDEARRDLVAAEELHRRRFETLKAELAEASRQASVWEKLALREASINGARLCGKEEAK